MATIGKRNTLAIERSSGPGLYLNGGELGEILLPGRYIPAGLKPGDKLDVFVYLDSEDRLVATTETPKTMVGEFACLKVISINPRVGAFLDWGLAKDLLLPFREQEVPVRVGKQVVVYVYLDPTSNRIVASTRLSRHLNRSGDTYQEKQAVNLMVISQTPLGYNVVVNSDRLGLLYHNSLRIPLTVGQKLKGYIRAVRPDGRLDVSLDRSGYQRVTPLKQQIVRALEEQGGHLNFDDSTPPEVIRERFACSKNAFKQALGALYKSRRIMFTKPGIQLLENADFFPGRKPAVYKVKAPGEGSAPTKGM